MKWPWTKRVKESAADAEKARTEYEWAVANRTRVESLVRKLTYHGETNGIIEALHKVAKGKA